MNKSILEAPYGNVIGMWVTYWGSRDAWYGKDFLIVDQGKDKSTSNRIAFMVPGVSDPVWRTLGPSFGDPFSKEVESKMFSWSLTRRARMTLRPK